MTDMDSAHWLNNMLVLLFAALCAAAVLFIFVRLRRNYWPIEKAPFWFDILQWIVLINTGMWSAKWLGASLGINA